MSKKIAKLTWLNNGNYGSLLQAYALQSHISQLGYEVEDIDYKASNKTKLLNWFKNGNSPYLFVGKIKEKVEKLRSKEKVDFTRRNELFKKFKEENIKTTRIYRSPRELKELINKYDAFVCGSDQIWSPKLMNPVFYFDFLPDSAYRISYAPSFGVSSIDEKKQNKIKKYIEKFNAISIREEKGSELIKELTGKDCSVQIDPTLLIDVEEWKKISKASNMNEKFIFCYLLTPNNEYIEMIKEFAKEKNLKVVIVLTPVGPFNTGFEEKIDVGPAEWLGLINEAEYICTDSFHGCIFSMLFNKQFTLFKRFSDNTTWSQNSRIYNLAKMFNVEDRIADSESKINLREEINYAKVNKLIEIEKNKSSEWLKQTLGEIK